MKTFSEPCVMFRLIAFFAALLFFLPVFARPSTAQAESSEIQQPLSFTGPRFQVEELTAQLHSDGTIVAVFGKVRNLSHQPANGHVIVYFTNATGAVVFATETTVNENLPFPHGDTASFETSVSTKNTPGTQNVSVEFVADNR